MKLRFPFPHLATIFFLLVLIGLTVAKNDKKPPDYRVYQYILRQVQGDFDEISQRIVDAFQKNGWRLVAQVDGGVPKDCPYRTRVLVLYDSSFAAGLFKANRKTAPFAVLDRINIFQDEEGTHISVVNPHSIVRTVMMDDWAFEDLSEAHLQKIRATITGAVEGKISFRTYGQKRGKGHIGKTMGVMAGGDFDKKLEDIAVVPNTDWKTVAAKVKEAMSKEGPKWGMHQVFELDLPEYQTAIFGTTGTPMDSKSFSIVKAGSDKRRKHFKCPGLAHAAAYPIEVVVTQEPEGVKVRLVNVMYRMKMYFEDAGKWAFMKNMGMPGSIASEIKTQIQSALGTSR